MTENRKSLLKTDTEKNPHPRARRASFGKEGELRIRNYPMEREGRAEKLGEGAVRPGAQKKAFKITDGESAQLDRKRSDSPCRISRS